MSENVFKGTPTVGCVIDHTTNPKVVFGECEHPDTCDFKYMTMTKEMYENFVKQGKKFVTLMGKAFDSLEEAGIDLDGDTIIVDGQKYAVNVKSWYLRRR